MDAVRGNYGLTARDTSPQREALRADLVAKAREVAPPQLLSETERQQVLGFYNTTLQDLDQIRDPKYAQDLTACFPWPSDERELYAALLVKRSDNTAAREVKDEYRHLLNDIKKEAALARKLVSKLGPGTHRLSNGDVVRISNDKSGNVTVRTESPDGSSKEVSYNTRNPGDARVQTTSADGQTTVSQRRGQTVIRKEDRVETTYSLDDQGRPVREARGPGHDDYTRTTVNKDGSTDTRELVYYSDEVDDGEDPAVYEDTHQPPRGQKYRDAGAGQAIEDFRKHEPQKITPDMLQKLIVAATADFDGQAAGKEYQDLKDYIAQVGDKLTPEARQVWQTYQKYVLAAQVKGQTGIERSEYDRMVKEMRRRPDYQDESAREAIEDQEKQNPSRIDERQVVDLILRATADPDNQSAGAEYRDLKRFVTANWDKLSPEARQKWQVYERFVQQARAQGQTGVSPVEYLRMMGELFG